MRAGLPSADGGSEGGHSDRGRRDTATAFIPAWLCCPSEIPHLFESSLTDGPDEIRRVFLVPASGLAALGHAVFMGWNAAQERRAQLWTSGVGLVVNVAVLCFWLHKQKVSALTAEVAIIGNGLLVAMFNDAIEYGLLEKWVYAILVMDLLLITECRGRAKRFFVAAYVTYMFVRATEQAWQWGLWQAVDHLGNTDSGADHPKPLGPARAASVLATSLIVFGLDYAITRNWVNRVKLEQRLVAESVVVAEEMALALVRFDLDAAARLMTDAASGGAAQELIAALRSLLQNLRLYRPYLPQAVFGDPGSPRGGSLGSPTSRSFPYSPGPTSDPESIYANALSMGFNGMVSPVTSSFPTGNAKRFRLSAEAVQQPDPPSLPCSPVHPECKSPAEELTELAVQADDEEKLQPLRFNLGGAAATISGPVRSRRRRPSLDVQRAQEEHRVRRQLAVGVRTRGGSVLCCRVHVVPPDGRFEESSFQVASSACAAAIDAVQEHSGIPSWVAADTVLASWNCHKVVTRHAMRAAHAAVALCHNLRDLPTPPPGGWQLSCACSQLLHGHMGTDSVRVPYVLGYAVTQARQLGGVAQHLGIDAVITEGVRERVRAHFHARPVDVVAAAPIEGGARRRSYAEHPPVVVYELVQGREPVEMADPLAPPSVHAGLSVEHERLYAEGFALFRCGRGEDAARRLRASLAGPDGSHHQQALRVLRLVALASAGGDKIPQPYLRRYLGWADYEAEAQAAPMPGGEEDDRLVESVQASLAQRPSSAAASPPTGRSRENPEDPLLPGSPRRQSFGGTVYGEFPRRGSEASAPHSPLLGGSPRESRREDDKLRWELHNRIMVQAPSMADLGGAGGRRFSGSGTHASPRRASAASSTIEHLGHTVGTVAASSAPDAAPQPSEAEGATTNNSTTPARANGDGAECLTAGDSSSFHEECGPLSFMMRHSQEALLDPAAAADPQAPPYLFEDTKGAVWHRSRRRLGRGAFGEVWLGMDDDGALVALKAVRLRNSSGAGEEVEVGEEVESLLREVSLLAELGANENLVAYLGSAVCHETGHVIVIVEYVPGGSLQSVVQSFGTLPLSSVQRFVRDIVRGLHFLHINSVAHRDLKLGNVLLGVEGQCKLADFGASVHMGAVGAGQQVTVGTPQYMAPEACRGEVCCASDLWALGVACVEMLTGSTPFRDMPAEPQAFVWRMAREADPVRVVLTDVPEGAPVEFVSSCLRRNPADRPSADDLLQHPFLI